MREATDHGGCDAWLPKKQYILSVTTARELNTLNLIDL